jgi:CHAT domain-containing protein
MQILVRLLIGAILTLSCALSYAQSGTQWTAAMTSGVLNRQQGNLDISINQFTQAAMKASNDQQRMLATGELGATLLQARHLDQAETPLLSAYAYFTGAERARYALDLGKLSMLRKKQKEAQRFYDEAVLLGGSDADVQVTAKLNLVRLAPATERQSKLRVLFEKVGNIAGTAKRAQLYLNLGNQARLLGTPALALTFESLDQARYLSGQTGNSRLQVEVLDALAQLYEDQGRSEDALKLTQQAIAVAHQLTPGWVADLLITLQWRQGRLHKVLGQDESALAAYQRAVELSEALRQDIPIEYEDGRSSFRATLEPIYQGLVNLLLMSADKQPGDGRQAYLRRAVNTVELIRQSELQDYLGDRCTVETVKGATSSLIPPRTAILYPVMLSDRTELLLDTESGIVRRSLAIAGHELRDTALAFATDLRNGDEVYLPHAKQLYNWLLRPFEAALAEHPIDNLVIVPDGALRLVAMGALHDGQRFAIEKFAITTVTGLSMTNTSTPSTQAIVSLVAGVSEFGPVVDKLSQSTIDQLFAPAQINSTRGLGLAKSQTLRSLRAVPANGTLDTRTLKDDAVERGKALRQALALPGVKDEIQAISKILPGTSMLNASFTLEGFRNETESGGYRILHVASHGVFGGSADASYILAYDDLLTLDRLQSLLKADQFRRNPIEILSLSACETAEGDDRSPLGISGAAIKARAKSVLGTLWPVEDNAARQVMEKFYGGITAARLSKAQALRQAQLQLIRSDNFAHPFFWAPFVLIGNWL